MTKAILDRCQERGEDQAANDVSKCHDSGGKGLGGPELEESYFGEPADGLNNFWPFT
jgi:hypothetical protein